MSGAWRDLSHPLSEDAPRIASFPAPQVRRLLCTPGDPMNVSAIDLCCHVGTHVDAPVHFVHGAPAIDELPLDRFYGPGVVVAARPAAGAPIDVDVFAGAEPAIRPGDIVFVSSGWSVHAGTDRYGDHPSLSVAAAEWLVERRVKLVGVDFATPDLPLDRRPSGFDWPVHRVLLGAGVLVAENLRDLAPLEGRRIDAMCLPLNLRGGDGAPARIVARPAD